MGTEPTQPQTLICTHDRPKFYTCELELDGLRVHRFEPTVEWAMFIAWNRNLMPDEYVSFYRDRFRAMVENSDVIVGKIANDRMTIVLDWFFKNFISDVGLLESLQALNLGDQYVCMTPAACERVKILDERTVPADECARWTDRAKNQRDYAIKVVDRIRLFHRRDGESFFEIMERETGVKLYAP